MMMLLACSSVTSKRDEDTDEGEAQACHRLRLHGMLPTLEQIELEGNLLKTQNKLLGLLQLDSVHAHSLPRKHKDLCRNPLKTGLS